MTVRPERPQGLGRGLAALIPQRAPGQPGPVDIAVDRIRPNPYQPRRHFDPAELETLTASVREHGILQPVLVTEAVDGYELVAGERRLRAAIAAGLERIPAIVRQLDDRSRLEIALIENLQREDLDPDRGRAGTSAGSSMNSASPMSRSPGGSAAPVRPSRTPSASSTSPRPCRPRWPIAG